MLLYITFSQIMKAFASSLLKHFLRIETCRTSRGLAFSETLILWLTSGDALLGKGSRFVFGCYDQCRTLQKVTSEDLLPRSGFG
jgi:hypothetical protein